MTQSEQWPERPQPGTAPRVLFYGAVLLPLLSTAVGILFQMTTSPGANQPLVVILPILSYVIAFVRLAMFVIAVWLVRGTTAVRRVVATVLVVLGTTLSAVAFPASGILMRVIGLLIGSGPSRGLGDGGGAAAPIGTSPDMVVQSVLTMVAVMMILCAWLVVRNRRPVSYILVIGGYVVLGIAQIVLNRWTSGSSPDTANTALMSVLNFGSAVIAPLWSVGLLLLAHAVDRTGRGKGTAIGSSTGPRSNTGTDNDGGSS